MHLARPQPAFGENMHAAFECVNYKIRILSLGGTNGKKVSTSHRGKVCSECGCVYVCAHMYFNPWKICDVFGCVYVCVHIYIYKPWKICGMFGCVFVCVHVSRTRVLFCAPHAHAGVVLNCS